MNIKTAEQLGPVDTVRLNKLRMVLAGDFTAGLDSFIRQSKIYITAIGAAIAETRMGDAMGIAHKLKSSSGLYGFWKVSEISNTIERSPMSTTSAMVELHQKLAAAFDEAVQALGDDTGSAP